MNRKGIVGRSILIAAAVGFLILGTVRKENETVFTKAVNICLECIGIG